MGSDTVTLQSFLDSHQYSDNGVLRYERIFGEDFVSTGGRETTENVVPLLNLKAGQKVLDVGCGTGGSAFYMANHYNVSVRGIDLSTNMIRFAQKKLEGKYPKLVGQVSFEVDDMLKMDIPDESFDVIYTRDALLHIEDKPFIFKRFHKWLKPGGKLLITDYCKGESKNMSKEFIDYLADRNYHLITVTEYAHILEGIFREVWSDDRTQLFISSLKRELAAFEHQRDGFVKDFTQSDFDALANGWKQKLVRTDKQEQAWGLFLATK